MPYPKVLQHRLPLQALAYLASAWEYWVPEEDLPRADMVGRSDIPMYYCEGKPNIAISSGLGQ